MLDTKITGGTIVDGSGRPGYRGDVGIRNGRIVAIGDVAEDARETLDATGKVVAPGFVDCHTHYDAQVFWDPTLSPSCFHGVTTVMGGFCGFSIAPLSPEAAGYLKPMLARVEGMPLKTLDIAVPWNWQSFGEYLAQIDGKIGLNAGFFAGHSAIRRVVMGERAVGEKSTPDELDKMKALLGKSIAEGAMGFSTTISSTHNDGDGQPVPSRWAEKSEIIDLCSVVRDYPGTGIEIVPGVEFTDEVANLLADMSVAGNRTVNWNVLAITGAEHDEANAAKQLNMSNVARAKGGEVVGLTLPTTPEVFLTMRSGFFLDALPGTWREIFQIVPEDRVEKLKDPAYRQQMLVDANSVPADAAMYVLGQFDKFVLSAANSAKYEKDEGRTVGEIAAEQGQPPFDMMLDISLEGDLDAVFVPGLGGWDHKTFELRSRIWHDDRMLIGGSDGGAHLDLIDTFALATSLLQYGVREHGVITLEEAVHQLTERPATLFGLKQRGSLAEGYHADITIFDPKTVAKGKTYNRYDVPGDAFRVYAEAIGIDHVFVNGVQIVRNGEHTGAMPGKVLKSGEDTATVALDALRHHQRQPEPALQK
jgi:N-acyl-D-aspartate/D-glutamate deacylase